MFVEALCVSAKATIDIQYVKLSEGENQCLFNFLESGRDRALRLRLRVFVIGANATRTKPTGITLLEVLGVCNQCLALQPTRHDNITRCIADFTFKSVKKSVKVTFAPIFSIHHSNYY